MSLSECGLCKEGSWNSEFSLIAMHDGACCCLWLNPLTRFFVGVYRPDITPHPHPHHQQPGVIVYTVDQRVPCRVDLCRGATCHVQTSRPGPARSRQPGLSTIVSPKIAVLGRRRWHAGLMAQCTRSTSLVTRRSAAMTLKRFRWVISHAAVMFHDRRSRGIRINRRRRGVNQLTIIDFDDCSKTGALRILRPQAQFLQRAEVYATANPSVRLSVRHTRYCFKTRERKGMRSSPSGSPLWMCKAWWYLKNGWRQRSSYCWHIHFIYAASIGTTTDDLEWPWMAVSRIARYLCGSWALLVLFLLHDTACFLLARRHEKHADPPP